jgi:hypothetical protein
LKISKSNQSLSSSPQQDRDSIVISDILDSHDAGYSGHRYVSGWSAGPAVSGRALVKSLGFNQKFIIEDEAGCSWRSSDISSFFLDGKVG